MAIKVRSFSAEHRITVGRIDVRLDDKELHELTARLMEAISKLPASRQHGPKLVCADLIYSDFGSNQDTQAYHWSATVTDGAVADDARRAVTVELERTKGFFSESAYVPSFPPDGYDVSDEPYDAVADVLADLRATMAAHQSDSIIQDDAYWKASGFAEAEFVELKTHFDAGLFEDLDYESCDLQHRMAEYCTAHDNDDGPPLPFARLIDTDLFKKLGRWIAGEDLTITGAEAA